VLLRTPRALRFIGNVRPSRRQRRGLRSAPRPRATAMEAPKGRIRSGLHQEWKKRFRRRAIQRRVISSPVARRRILSSVVERARKRENANSPERTSISMGHRSTLSSSRMGGLVIFEDLGSPPGCWAAERRAPPLQARGWGRAPAAGARGLRLAARLRTATTLWKLRAQGRPGQKGGAGRRGPLVKGARGSGAERRSSPILGMSGWTQARARPGTGPRLPN